MKKLLLIAGIIAIAGCVLIFVPAKLTISKVMTGKFSIMAASRYLSDTSKWNKWWPESKKGLIAGAGRQSSFVYKGYSYIVTGIFYNEVHLCIQNEDNSEINGAMRIAQLDKDSILLGVECQLRAGNNPFKKIKAYRRRKEIRENMAGILEAFKAFMEVTRNVYGLKIERPYSKDSVLVTLSRSAAAYPTTAYIYQLIDSVKQYVDSHDAIVISPPMLNVAKSGNNEFRTMVALSVNKRLEGNSRIIVKRFVPYKMIEGEAHGGVYSVDKAMEQLYKFRDDNQLSIMSIPFQSLVTDRRKEQDTTQWITIVCAPVS